MQSTTNYAQFKLTEDNRANGVDNVHLQAIISSIQQQNRLHLNPILVNGKDEVIQGQHRLRAAEYLELPIYYIKDESLTSQDLVRLNLGKAWTMPDYHNFYCLHGHGEYLKFQEFIDKQKLPFNVALGIALGVGGQKRVAFKEGGFEFNETLMEEDLMGAWTTIEILTQYLGKKSFFMNGKFWKALLLLTTNPNFKMDQWKKNLLRFCQNITPKASWKDYAYGFQDIYNWRCRETIQIFDLNKSLLAYGAE